MQDATYSSEISGPPRDSAGALSLAPVGWWLAGVTALIWIMAMVGAATRLTESGLSMVDWAPVTGFLPPLSQSDWLAEFSKYSTSPQYTDVNSGMSLAQFKSIYLWEFWHRNLGRFIGLAFALPLAFFALTRRVKGAFLGWLLVLLVLGGSQGALGWYMVKSGLVDVPAVSHYRLAAHLSLALTLMTLVFWTCLSVLSRPAAAAAPLALRAFAVGFAVLLGLQIVYGAFVAGLDAGFAYNSWPLMNGAMVPDGLFTDGKGVRAYTEGMGTVQFLHRMFAYGLALYGFALSAAIMRMARDGAARSLAVAIALAVLSQVGIGIATILNTVPVWLGTLHQGWAALILLLTAALTHRLWAPRRIG